MSELCEGQLHLFRCTHSYLAEVQDICRRLYVKAEQPKGWTVLVTKLLPPNSQFSFLSSALWTSVETQPCSVICYALSSGHQKRITGQRGKGPALMCFLLLSAVPTLLRHRGIDSLLPQQQLELVYSSNTHKNSLIPPNSDTPSPAGQCSLLRDLQRAPQGNPSNSETPITLPTTLPLSQPP